MKTESNKFNRQRVLFGMVIDAYRKLLALSPVVASAIDPDAPTHSRKLDFCAVDYKVDITNAVRDSFKNQPDEEALKNAIDRMIEDDPTVPPVIAWKVIRLCSKTFSDRHLEPALYLKRIRRGSAPQQRAAA
jgi:hypothetical protein